MLRIQRGDEKATMDLFCFAAPKFITPSFPNFRAPKQVDQEQPVRQKRSKAAMQQFTVFITDVREQSMLSTIRSFLKLYTTIPASKLAGFMEIDEPTLIQHLICSKHKNSNLIRAIGPATSGDRSTSSDIDFYLDKGMIHVVGTKIVKRYGEFFIRHINKFDDIIRDIRKNK